MTVVISFLWLSTSVGATETVDVNFSDISDKIFGNQQYWAFSTVYMELGIGDYLGKVDKTIMMQCSDWSAHSGDG